MDEKGLGRDEKKKRLPHPVSYQSLNKSQLDDVSYLFLSRVPSAPNLSRVPNFRPVHITREREREKKKQTSSSLGTYVTYVCSDARHHSDRLHFQRGVNRLTDQRILTVFSPGFRIQSKILTDLRILQLQRFAVFIDFWARSLDFACDKVRIVDHR